jgi:hypothetical protein
MNTTNRTLYTIQVPKQSTIDLQKKISFIKQYIFKTERNYLPMTLHFGPSLKQIIDGDLLARRVGLTAYTTKQGLKIDESEFTEKVKIVNETEAKKWVKTEDLNLKRLDPVCGDQYLFVIPAQTTLEFQITFTQNRGISNARASVIEGIRFDQTQKNYSILFESMKDFSDILNQMKKEIDLVLFKTKEQFVSHLDKEE